MVHEGPAPLGTYLVGGAEGCGFTVLVRVLGYRFGYLGIELLKSQPAHKVRGLSTYSRAFTFERDYSLLSGLRLPTFIISMHTFAILTFTLALVLALLLSPWPPCSMESPFFRLRDP